MLRLRRRLALLLVLLLAGAGVVVALWMGRPRWSVERVRDTVVATLQAEAPASELVTGRVRLTARRQIHDRGRFSWLPAWLELPGLLGAQAEVEVEGEALYGFDVRGLTPEMIEVHPDGLVEVRLPALHVVAVEADLARLRVRTQEGVFRRGEGARLAGEALRDVQAVLREQGARHLETSAQPGIHTARALQAMLAPPLVAAGLEEPRFRFHLGEDLMLQPPAE